MKPIFSKTQDTRLAGLERRVRFLERREQLPNPLTIDDLGGGPAGLMVEIVEGNDFSTVGAVLTSVNSLDYFKWYDSQLLTGYPNPLIGVDPADERIIYLPVSGADCVYRIDMECAGLENDPRASVDPSTDPLQYISIRIYTSYGAPGSWHAVPGDNISGSAGIYGGYRSSDNIPSVIDTVALPQSGGGELRRWVSFVWNLQIPGGTHASLMFQAHQPLFGSTGNAWDNTHQTCVITRLI